VKKKALVIGASSGIGRELAKLLVNDGYYVAITGRRLEELEKIRLENPDSYCIRRQDVTQIAASEKVFAELVQEFETIDLIVYSSGVAEPNYDLDWNKELPVLETNVLGAVKIYGLAYSFFKKQGYGHLVGISSVAGVRGNRHVPAYFASKAFQSNYLESLWMKAKRSKASIYVTDIVPGFVDTKMALGDTFGMASLEKASRQIYSAIKLKKKKAYITRRWQLIAAILRFVPAGWIAKM
jgi:short-subunit dehydrogenase